MLTHLRIQNFAIIHDLTLQLEAGLSTFTGETGAGKSIILDGIEVLVGGKTDAGQIRAGEDKSLLEAEFTLNPQVDQEVLQILEREELNDGLQLLLSREIRKEGRSPARVNGRSVSTALLKEIGSCLVDIHGQSEHLSLLNTRQHLSLLDRYAQNESSLKLYQDQYRSFQALKKELSELQRSEQETLQRGDLLRFQVQEIEAARLQPDEEEPLKQERDRLAHAEVLAANIQESLLLLDEGNPEGQPISEGFGQVVKKIEALLRYDASLKELSDNAAVLEEQISDLSRSLRSYQEQIEFNPRRLQQVDDRLNTIQLLKKKYGNSVSAVIEFGRQAKAKLEGLEHSSERKAELEGQIDKLKQAVLQAGYELRKTRQQASQTLEKAIEGELADLSMAGARFQVEILPLADGDGQPAPTDQGLDQVQFLIAPNPGEGLKPMVKIASGGETSRLMLALKNVLTRADSVPTLIFDEIDQGISGRVGSMVGEKLWLLGRNHQVFCVTHLAQLAAFGDQHFSVRKLVDAQRTSTQVVKLSKEQRAQELTQLIGNTSATGLAGAAEMLQRAEERKQGLKANQKA